MILTSKIILLSSLIYVVMCRHLDFRERFLERKRLRALNAQRVTVLNKLENTVILDDIPHYRKWKGRSLKKIRAIEKDFRRLLAMDGMKYTYKRDLFWRTWRSIPLLYGANKEIVCYKCNNLKHANGTTYQSCGTWSIEDSTPPCPFEFFSLKSDETFCGVNITQYKDVNHKCPSNIKFSDLTATCDNPIETHWRFTKMYGVTEEKDNVICNNHDFCEIFTSYEITSDLVVFRIINSTNDVIYSRIMKPKHKNYVCIDDCGHFNPETRKITKVNGKPMRLDLLTRKTKRNDLANEIFAKKELLKELNEDITKRQDLLKGKNHLPALIHVKKTDLLNEMNKIVTKSEDLQNGKHEHVTKKDLNRKNENITKKRNTLIKNNKNVTKRKKLLNKNVKKKEKLNDSEMVRDEVLNEINKSDVKDDFVHEMNESDAKEDLVNETNERDTCTDEHLNEMNDSDADEDVLYDSTNISGMKTEKIINELLPMEKDLSTPNWGGSKFDLFSVEVNDLHKIKSNKQFNFTIEREPSHSPKVASGQKYTLAFNKQDKHSDSMLHKPTVTPRVKLKKKKHYISYEDENQDYEYA